MSEPTWLTRDKVRMTVGEMTDSHLLNLERFLAFRGVTAPGFHPGFFRDIEERVAAEIQTRGLERLPTITTHKIPPCPFADAHSYAVDITDYFPCFFCEI